MKSSSNDDNLHRQLLTEYEKITKQLHETVDVGVYTNLVQIMKNVLDYELEADTQLKGAIEMIMEAEVWELPTEKMMRLGQHKSVDMLIKKKGMTEEEACELIEVKLEEYREYKEKQRQELSQEERANEMILKKPGGKKL